MCLYKHIIAITTFYREAIHCVYIKKKLIAKLAINWYGVNHEKNKSKCLNQQNKEIKFVTFNLSAL